MAEIVTASRDRSVVRVQPLASSNEYARGWRVAAIFSVLLLINAFSQIDRILPFILAEKIKAELFLTDTQMGLLTGLAFAVCYALLSLPLARAADRGSPRLVLVSCVLIWSVMTALGGLAASFMFLALTRFGVAFGEAGAVPAGHALIARKIEPDRRGLAIGLFAMGIPLGTMAGFAAGGAIADIFGWRVVLTSAGAIGILIGLLTVLVAGPTPRLQIAATRDEPFLRTSLDLLTSPAFRWLFIGTIFLGFAGAPFYAFSVPFLIRTHEFTATEVGVVFGLLQGLMGIVGTLGGGRWFDHAVRSGSGKVLGPPAILFMIASVTTTAALFAPAGWMAIVLFVPAMLSFSFMLPWGFGAAHLVAGVGRQAQASSLVMIGSGLVGPALGPLFVGMVSDAASAADIPNGLALGLLIVPLASVLSSLALLVANHRVGVFLRQR
ncbi:MFS transporter [Kaistia dalseonensis]|uniref:MFS family arabinose efflux permease n=1 Tax=Kaistia dalseonensis TaxID=410840 RepID=A0ABU0H2J1_9HYPH|nr:MFS transporter [Kaistia dalseonensis]MCX5493946.1 MFS transporter [Kaistia dalseonensis]MDQ0436521.1 putative MFS family arabinose efflux permease [Kaistia dalseonensis]